MVQYDILEGLQAVAITSCSLPYIPLEGQGSRFIHGVGLSRFGKLGFMRTVFGRTLLGVAPFFVFLCRVERRYTMICPHAYSTS